MKDMVNPRTVKGETQKNLNTNICHQNGVTFGVLNFALMWIDVDLITKPSIVRKSTSPI